MVRLLKSIFNHSVEPIPRPTRRAPRVFIAGNTVQFKSARWQGSAIPLYNISATGVAFRQGFFPQLPIINELIHGQLTIDGSEFDVQLKVVHLVEPLVGCAFANHLETLEQSLNQKFECELAAHSLVKINPAILAPVAEGTPYFYFGKNKEELYFVRASNVITKFNLCFQGIYLEGGRNRQLKMGVIAEPMGSLNGEDSSFLRPEVSFFDEINPLLIDRAKAFLRNIQWLSGDNVRLISKLLEVFPQKNH